MKTLKTTIVLTILFASFNLSAQEEGGMGIAKKKMKWMDADKDGVVTLEEMKVFYKDKKRPNGKPYYPETLFLGTDKDGDGMITVEEFASGVDWKLAKSRKKD